MARAVTFQIQEGALPDSQPLLACKNVGAVVTFQGVVRNTEQGRVIEGLDYVAYQPMADRTLEQLGSEAIQRLGVLAVHVEHSRGFVPSGQCSFRLIVAATHRREAIDAMDWFIDRLKETVPIWKRPIFADTTAEDETSDRRP